MPLHIFNTLSKSLEPFSSIEEGIVRIYTCGPTVYGRPHIGNYASFLMADLLRRWLEVSGYSVVHAKNITDVGHLVADADDGEDKIEKEARLQSKDPLEIAEYYAEQYLEDERELNFIEPEHRPKATETIQEMITLIEHLVETRVAYETEDGVYFSVEHFPAYGKLSGNTLEKMSKLQESVRVEVSESKNHPADFALWKKCVGANAHHILRWDSPWGEGFPGWHIECSAMSEKFLGQTFDIHTGGEDNIFPHHECEIAQSEAAAGKQVVQYWMHRRRINFSDPSVDDGRLQKMSKSLGNVLTIPDIVEANFHPLDLRYFFCTSHYRSHAQFTWKGLDDAKKARRKIIDWMKELKQQPSTSTASPDQMHDIQSFTNRFDAALDDDLNTPEAIAVLFEIMPWSRTNGLDTLGSSLLPFVTKVQHTFGCFDDEETFVPDAIQSLVQQREDARSQKDFETADRLRDEILAAGFILEDVDGGVRVVPASHR